MNWLTSFASSTIARKNLLLQLEALLDAYYERGEQLELGVPTVNYCADQLDLSANYFGDLIKLETGLPAKTHIQNWIIARAIHKVVCSTYTVSEISYLLGFNYPQHFCRFFKNSRTNTGSVP
ncbi:helix-turn-helix domain-containing protein [Sphingobacterium chungjuense]|uniref:helix-turn-helix domain-containing protein n=1 Tax=Sphingobacterium chungjuense TaxID=2675553 RepID=UPI00140AEF4F|nr:helix-turn-helix domain-containing protein [Sphingobacterium chungjuense]